MVNQQTLAVQVAIMDQFFEAYAALPKNAQKKCMEFIKKFRHNPRSSGINYEHINDACDSAYRSVRIDQNFRGIVRAPDDGNVYLLLWVDKHDDAYHWARRHQCNIHSTTGTLQVYESEVVDSASMASSAVGSEESVSGVTTESASAVDSFVKDEPLFQLTKGDLLEAGVPEDMVLAVKSLVRESQLEAIEKKLPLEAFEALYLHAAGTPWDEVISDRQNHVEVDTSDMAAALDRTASQRRFWLIDDDNELEKMLNAPLERWRVFLHPSQRKLVERNWNGPVRVLGGAGTGKTVVAMHRARWLAKTSLQQGKKILFTTFTANLATDIESSLRKICTPEQMADIEIRNIDRWVSDFLRRSRYPHTIVYENSNPSYKQLWERALTLKPPELGLPDSFYREEWQRVVVPQRISDQKGYFKALRTGRGVALNRKQRSEIWPVFEEVRAQMHHQGLKTFEDAALDAVDILQRDQTRLPYQSVIVDEAQDMGPEMFTLLRHLVPEQANDLFIVGDGHQRIYRRKTALSQCGIRIVGRSRKLKINYRTTEETRKFACAVLEGVEVDDLDGGVDGQQDYRSLMHGSAPTIQGYDSSKDEALGLARLIETLTAQAAEPLVLEDCCIVTRTGWIRDEIQKILNQEGIGTRVLDQKQDNRDIKGIRLATMHRVKGLEFRYVFLAGINEGVVPLKVALNNSADPVEQRQNELNERALLHVAASRAVKGLYVSFSGTPSRFLS